MDFAAWIKRSRENHDTAPGTIPRNADFVEGFTAYIPTANAERNAAAQSPMNITPAREMILVGIRNARKNTCGPHTDYFGTVSFHWYGGSLSFCPRWRR